MTGTASCKERIGKEYHNEIATIRKLWELYRKDSEASDPDLGNWTEHGLCFDYVAPGTFTGQRRGYFRYQISTGGPGDEFRFFTDENLAPVRIEYWFLDWWDGAKKVLTGKDEELMLEIWEDWKDCGVPEHAMQQAKG